MEDSEKKFLLVLVLLTALGDRSFCCSFALDNSWIQGYRGLGLCMPINWIKTTSVLKTFYHRGEKWPPAHEAILLTPIHGLGKPNLGPWKKPQFRHFDSVSVEYYLLLWALEGVSSGAKINFREYPSAYPAWWRKQSVCRKKLQMEAVIPCPRPTTTWETTTAFQSCTI